MDWKKLSIAFVAAFGFMFLFGFLWYGKLMHGAHQEVPALWRTETELGRYFQWVIFGDIGMAFLLTLLCAKFVRAGGAGSCAVFSVLVALVFISHDLILYAVQPVTVKILCGWILGDLIMFGVAGAIIGAIYKIAAPVTVKPESRPL